MTESNLIEHFKHALVQTMRSIAEEPELNVSFSGDHPSLAGLNARLSPPAHDMTSAAQQVLRGQADALALTLAHHDRALAAAMCPQDIQARLSFEAIEQARCEALGARRMRGIAANLDAMHEARARSGGFAAIDQREQAPLSEVLGFIVREYLTGTPPPASAQRMVDLWRDWVEARGHDNLARLSDVQDDQVRFAQETRTLLRAFDLIEDENDDEQQIDEPQDDTPDDENSDNSGEEKGSPTQDDDGGAGEASEQSDDDQSGDNASLAEGDRQSDEVGQESLNTAIRTYSAYTTRYDEITTAENLCDIDELVRLRAHLDKQLQNLQGLVGRLANRLQRLLQARQNRSWAFDLEEGHLDSARLTRVIIDPTHPLSYKMERSADFRDTIVTLLLDNSGSMRGRPIAVAAMCADILAGTLERCNVKTEILGFTTRAWKGGQSRDDWIEAGQPAHPGRLNDLRHIIYKSADMPWRRARRNLGMMMREGLLKENIDGEALLWAYQRLRTRPENRRILMVISDGAPIDDSTLSTNNGNYLDRHLREIIDKIETSSPIELIAIGIGHDVTRYYSDAVTIDDPEQLGGTMIQQLVQLFDEHPHDNRRQMRARSR